MLLLVYAPAVYIRVGGSLADCQRSCDNDGKGREDVSFLDTRLQVVAHRT